MERTNSQNLMHFRGVKKGSNIAPDGTFQNVNSHVSFLNVSSSHLRKSLKLNSPARKNQKAGTK